MKTKVKFVKVLLPDGTFNTVATEDEHGNLKYNQLIRMAKENVLDWSDERTQNVFVEIAEQYRKVSAACKKARD